MGENGRQTKHSDDDFGMGRHVCSTCAWARYRNTLQTAGSPRRGCFKVDGVTLRFRYQGRARKMQSRRSFLKEGMRKDDGCTEGTLYAAKQLREASNLNLYLQDRHDIENPVMLSGMKCFRIFEFGLLRLWSAIYLGDVVRWRSWLV